MSEYVWSEIIRSKILFRKCKWQLLRNVTDFSDKQKSYLQYFTEERMKNDTFFKEEKLFTFSKVKIQAILINKDSTFDDLWITCWWLWTSSGVMIYKMWSMIHTAAQKKNLYWNDVLMYLFLSPVLEWILAFSSTDNKFYLPWSTGKNH